MTLLSLSSSTAHAPRFQFFNPKLLALCPPHNHTTPVESPTFSPMFFGPFLLVQPVPSHQLFPRRFFSTGQPLSLICSACTWRLLFSLVGLRCCCFRSRLKILYPPTRVFVLRFVPGLSFPIVCPYGGRPLLFPLSVSFHRLFFAHGERLVFFPLFFCVCLIPPVVVVSRTYRPWECSACALFFPLFSCSRATDRSRQPIP